MLIPWAFFRDAHRFPAGMEQEVARRHDAIFSYGLEGIRAHDPATSHRANAATGGTRLVEGAPIPLLRTIVSSNHEGRTSMSAVIDDDRGRCPAAFRHDHQYVVTLGKLSSKNPHIPP